MRNCGLSRGSDRLQKGSYAPLDTPRWPVTVRELTGSGDMRSTDKRRLARASTAGLAGAAGLQPYAAHHQLAQASRAASCEASGHRQPPLVVLASVPQSLEAPRWSPRQAASATRLEPAAPAAAAQPAESRRWARAVRGERRARLQGRCGRASEVFSGPCARSWPYEFEISKAETDWRPAVGFPQLAYRTHRRMTALDPGACFPTRTRFKSPAGCQDRRASPPDSPSPEGYNHGRL